ncbi:hypothetical protein FQN54_000825 [Arachnomyces sp. PD_36]|nr:hypothetical protein FQN54_000825 [Arachnomyces sp. PD_36]
MKFNTALMLAAMAATVSAAAIPQPQWHPPEDRSLGGDDEFEKGKVDGHSDPRPINYPTGSDSDKRQVEPVPGSEYPLWGRLPGKDGNTDYSDKRQVEPVPGPEYPLWGRLPGKDGNTDYSDKRQVEPVPGSEYPLWGRLPGKDGNTDYSDKRQIEPVPGSEYPLWGRLPGYGVKEPGNAEPGNDEPANTDPLPVIGEGN